MSVAVLAFSMRKEVSHSKPLRRKSVNAKAQRVVLEWGLGAMDWVTSLPSRLRNRRPQRSPKWPRVSALRTDIHGGVVSDSVVETVLKSSRNEKPYEGGG